jgi:hypothetical protein
MGEIFGGMFYGAFILFPMIVILIGGVMALIGGALSRPHDTRMNTQEMVFKIVARIVDHREWMTQHSHHIEALAPPMTTPPLADPVKRVQIRAPENAIEGTWWECESPAQQRALVALFGDREIVEVREK